MTQRLALAVAACGLAAVTTARAQSTPETALVFPASLERQAVIDWMKRETDLTPSAVVAVTPSALTGVLTSMSTPEGLSRRLVILRSEALSADGLSKSRAASWTSAVVVDCKTRKARLGRTMAYAQRNLMGEGHETKAANPAWVDPPPNGAVAIALLRVCDAKGVSPLISPNPVETVAKAEPPPVPVAPRPASSRAAPPTARAMPFLRPAISPAQPAGARTSRVQIGAAATEAEAQRLLGRARERVGEMPAGVSTLVVKAQVGGKTFYRAQFTGFGSLSKAADFCRALTAEGGTCFARGPAGS